MLASWTLTCVPSPALTPLELTAPAPSSLELTAPLALTALALAPLALTASALTPLVLTAPALTPLAFNARVALTAPAAAPLALVGGPLLDEAESFCASATAGGGTLITGSTPTNTHTIPALSPLPPPRKPAPRTSTISSAPRALKVDMWTGTSAACAAKGSSAASSRFGTVTCHTFTAAAAAVAASAANTAAAAAAVSCSFTPVEASVVVVTTVVVGAAGAGCVCRSLHARATVRLPPDRMAGKA
mmetsp:Transcript_24465/g.60935  ORF Transcript_24465/g.60935 Transcript_24465/m.60935 type:complete len:245 (+) Transcript_24465:2766-3500(+)